MKIIKSAGFSPAAIPPLFSRRGYRLSFLTSFDVLVHGGRRIVE
ncbi:hypothetical protein [Candidatus Methylacidiphilum infernorum]|nr:hypothetical protein [Candidatus Methylacidiphilum infernorum]